MPHILDDTANILLPVKDDLITLGALLEKQGADTGAGDLVPQLDTTLKRAYGAANGARRLLLLARAPNYADFDPAAALRELGAFVPQKRESTQMVIEAIRFVRGDREQMAEAFRIVGENIELGSGARLRITVSGEAPARIVLELSGEGVIGDPLSVDGVHDMDWEDFGVRWTAATDGGHVGLDASAVILYLEGDRPVPETYADLDTPLSACKNLSRRLSSWRGAIGHYEPGMVDESEIVAIYRDIVDRSMADINRILDAIGGHNRAAR